LWRSSIGGKKRCLLITGPNAGGKTVALKTIGIVTLLARTGLHVPCEDGTSVALFGRIYADIGDEQSIELSLSTFSSHMKNTIEILHSADRDSLILLDEVGAGTDPFEGSAIARAIIEELMETGATVVATTHHMSLKVFAHENQLLENASMEFDSDNLRPTYRLIQGVPGASHAFEIASRLGMSDRVLTKARSYCGDERVRFEELTKDLLDKMKKISAEQATVEVKRRKADETLMEYRKKLEEIKKHDRELRRKALKEAREVVEDAKRTVRGLVKELKEKETQPQRAKSIQKQIREESHKIKEAIQEIDEAGETRKPLGSVVVGARAYVRPLSKEGTVLTEPDEKGRLEVVVGSLRVEVGVADLLEPWGEAAPKSAGAVEFEAREVPGEIDVRGMTAEDAWEAVDRYLDDAALYGHPSVRVIHGKGKGVLSKRIKEMLTSHPRVGSHRFGDLAEGGAGVTIVEIEKG
jgi:DNA mismatch repair protein MutS2